MKFIGWYLTPQPADELPRSLLVTAGYTLILPGIFLHLCCIAAAASSAHRLNSSLARVQLGAG